MAKQKLEILEKDRRFSESMIWSAQRDFYHQQGVDAWVDEVPFYITSNPFIADCYANVIMAFIQDWCHKHPLANSNPFYILELGTGSGQFSFYLLKTLCEYRDKLKLDDIVLRYVMTDFTENNLKFWREHPALKPYVEKGILDFAVYDFEHDNKLILSESKSALTAKEIQNPAIVLANYLFDTLTSDVFSVSEEGLHESLVVLKADKANIGKNRPKNWQKVKMTYEEKSIKSPYYNDKDLDQVLFSYEQLFTDTHFLYPIGSLKGLQHLLKLSNGRLFLLTSDKGYTTIEQQDECEVPELDFHGSFSLMANYHAIAQFFKLHGGDAYMPTERDGLVTAVFASGMQFSEMPRTSEMLDKSIDGMSPTDYFNFYEYLLQTYSKLKLPVITSFLNFSHWDPMILEEVNDRIEALMEDAAPELITFLVKNLHKVAENFYYLPKVHDTLFDIAVFYQNAEHYEEAIHYFKESMRYFDPEFSHYFNLGLCHFYSEEKQQALDYFKKAEPLSPKSKELKEMMLQCE